MKTSLRAVLVVVVLSAIGIQLASAATTNPRGGDQLPGPAQILTPVGGAVTAVVVRSWGTESEYLVWQHLNDSWSLYGPTPVLIDYTTLHAVGSFTLADLEASGADVVIVSDPCGGLRQWTPEEASALQTYALEGHNLVGTFLLFQWGGSGFDNSFLAPLWGLVDEDYHPPDLPAPPSIPLLEPGHCLFKMITGPLQVGGYPYLQVPADSSWDEADLNGAVYVARTSDGAGVVTAFEAGSYRAFYINFMPEFRPGDAGDATQLLYNAITCEHGPTATAGCSWGGLKQRFDR